VELVSEYAAFTYKLSLQGLFMGCLDR